MGSYARPGDNQYMSGGPSVPASNTSLSGGPGGGSPIPNPYSNNPYQVPAGGSGYFTGPGASSPSHPWPDQKDYSRDIGHGIVATGLQYPDLSQNFMNYLMSQIGQGMQPFNLGTPLPSGGASQPGQLSAGMNPLLTQLAQFFQTGQGGGAPGLNTLSTIANNGISALPEWQSMIDAQQQNIHQNEANLKEQFGAMGNLAGSPFGTAMSNFEQQTTKDQNALLGQLQQTNILQGQIPVAQGLLAGGTQMAGGLQSLDQSAIDRMLQEFQRVSPQNNPMNQYIGAFGSLYPPTTKTPTTWDMVNQTIGALSGSGISKSSSPGGGSSSQITF